DPNTGQYVYVPPSGYVGEDSFEYTVCDDGNPQACDTATVYIEILPKVGPDNESPIANADTAGTEKDTPVTGNVLVNDYDPDGDTIVVTTTTVTTTEGVVVTIDPNTGEYVYTPPPGFTGDDSFEYTICDDGDPELCDTAVVVITVSSNIGNVTIANDDAYNENNCGGIAGSVLDNDSDPEGDDQTVNTTPVVDVANGTLVLNADGTFSYIPNEGFTGTDSFVYSVCDNGTPQACDQATVYITIIDSVPPSIDDCDLVDETVECSGTDNESIAAAWNAANIALLEDCAIDSCDMDLTGQVTSDYDFSNFETTCGLSGSITVLYTIADDSGNFTTLEVTLTFEDTTPPDVSSCDITDMTLDCTLNDAEDIADQWNLDNITAIQNCATDGCSVNNQVTVTSNYDFNDLVSGQLPVIYTIADDCGNESTLEALLTLQNSEVVANDISLCVDSEVESQVFNLFNLLEGNYNTGGTWEVISGSGDVIDGNFFDPTSIELIGENASEIITFSYTELDSECPTYIEASIDVNNECAVLACNLDNLEISMVLTPNGDVFNEFFRVTGLVDCDFTIDVKIVNRWGAIIFESNDYQNNWNAFAHSSSVGSAGQVPSGTYYYVVTLIDSGLDPITGPMYIGTK
ncbi:MAG: tandem-95 repeat protein, partial [Winogradskyella sp.]|nr:tandem-95 repeat protein [Winogradskyella sp.]